MKAVQLKFQHFQSGHFQYKNKLSFWITMVKSCSVQFNNSGMLLYYKLPEALYYNHSRAQQWREWGWGGGRMLEKVPLRVEPERSLDEGTEWVVGRSTETVDSSPSTESMDSLAAAPWTESVDFSLSWVIQRMSLYPSLGLRTVPS